VISGVCLKMDELWLAIILPEVGIEGMPYANKNKVFCWYRHTCGHLLERSYMTVWLPRFPIQYVSYSNTFLGLPRIHSGIIHLIWLLIYALVF
jgi:hypothetical protein